MLTTNLVYDFTAIEELVGITFLTLYLPIWTVFTFWFYKRMEFQPIRARNPQLVLVCNFIFLIWGIGLAGARIESKSFPCWLIIWSGFIGIIIVILIYVLRCGMLVFKFNFARVQIMLLKTSDKKEKKQLKQTFWYRNKQMLHMAYWKWRLLIVSLVLLIPLWILSGTRPEMFETFGNSCERAWGDIFIVLYGALGIVMFISFAIKLRVAANGFRIKGELRRTGILGVFVMIPWVLFNNIASLKDINHGRFPISTTALFFGLWFNLIFSTGVPLYWSYADNYGLSFKKAASDDKDVTIPGYDLSLLTCLNNYFKQFYDFLETEFSAHNALFWQDVIKFKNDFEQCESPKQAAGGIKALYLNYIAEEAPAKLNLKAHHYSDYKDVADKIEDGEYEVVTKQVFDVLEDYVVKTNLLDPYIRFLNTPEGAKLLKAEKFKKEHDVDKDVVNIQMDEEKMVN